MSFLDFLAPLLNDPTAAGGGFLSKLLGIGGAGAGAPPVPSAPYSPFTQQSGILGNSPLVSALRSGFVGMSGANGYTGLSAVGAGAKAATKYNQENQQFRQNTALGGQQFASGNQALAEGNLALGQKLRNYNLWDRAYNPGAHVDLTYADLSDPAKLAKVMSFTGGGQQSQGGTQTADTSGATPIAPQLDNTVNPTAPPSAAGAPLPVGPPSSPGAGPAVAPAAGTPDMLSAEFLKLYGMTPQAYAALGRSMQDPSMVAEAAKYDSSLITGTEKAKTAGGPPLNLRSGSVALDPVTHQPIYQNPIKQDVYNPDTGRTETRWVTPATSGSGLPVGPPTSTGMVNQNNPGNIRPTGQSTGFRNYPDLASGINGVVQNLTAYGQKGINTVSKIVSTWAPPSDNNDTQAYIADVAGKLGVGPNAPLDMNNQKVLTGLSLAMINHEQGGLAGQGGNTAQNPNSLPQGPSAGDTEAMKGYAQQRLNFEQGVQPTLIGIQRMQAIAEALKTFKSGWGAEQMAHVNSIFKRLGMDSVNSVDPAQFQIVMKNNWQAAVTQMMKFSSNPAAISLQSTSDNFANGDLQPEANLAIVAQGIGTSQWQLDATKAMQKAKIGGTQDPNAFMLDWAEQHPLQPYIDKASKDIGPLAGMGGANGTGGASPPAGVTKVWKMDASGNLVPAQ